MRAPRQQSQGVQKVMVGVEGGGQKTEMAGTTNKFMLGLSLPNWDSHEAVL